MGGAQSGNGWSNKAFQACSLAFDASGFNVAFLHGEHYPHGCDSDGSAEVSSMISFNILIFISGKSPCRSPQSRQTCCCGARCLLVAPVSEMLYNNVSTTSKAYEFNMFFIVCLSVIIFRNGGSLFSYQDNRRDVHGAAGNQRLLETRGHTHNSEF